MKTSIFLEVEVEIDFDPQKAERMTWHYPGCPAHIEINEIKLPTADEVVKQYEQEIHDACWDEVIEEEQEREIMRAEYRRDAMREDGWN